MKHEIKNRYTGEVLFTFEYDEKNTSGIIVRDALEKALSFGADLRCADLRFADFRFANLEGADLRFADLRFANLEGAKLEGADLRYADLRFAKLEGAKLEGANLECAKNAPLIISGLSYTCYIDGMGNMRIGCQIHTVEEWKKFTDEQIKDMDSEALEFWNKHKSMLLSICDSYKHS